MVLEMYAVCINRQQTCNEWRIGANPRPIRNVYLFSKLLLFYKDHPEKMGDHMGFGLHTRLPTGS
jgi:hypothetical protein